jgi:hypothetical protein
MDRIEHNARREAGPYRWTSGCSLPGDARMLEARRMLTAVQASNQARRHTMAIAEQNLSSSVFTADVERGVRFAKRIGAGMTPVNDQTVNDLANQPFGGAKNSGVRFGGDWTIQAFTTDHWITVQHEPPQYARSATGIIDPGTGC